MSQEIIAKLERAIEDVNAETEVAGDYYVGTLLAAAGQAVGALKMVGELKYDQMCKDMVALAAMAGELPDHVVNRNNNE